MGLLSKDGIIKGVIVATLGGAGAAGIIALAAYLGLTPPAFVAWLQFVWSYLVADIALPHWVFWSWTLMSAIVITLIAARLYFELASPAWAAYRSDILFGLRWRWNLSASGAVQYPPQMFCPKCDHQFSGNIFSYGDPAENVWHFTCETCDYEGKVPISPDLQRKVKQEVERRLRTGEWKQAK